MAKQLNNKSYIFKISSTRLRKSKWNLSMTTKEARENKELVGLLDSSTLRYLRLISNNLAEEKRIAAIKKLKIDIKKLGRKKTTQGNRETISAKNNELRELMFMEHYVCVVIDRNSDFDRMNTEKGFYINNRKYKRFLATPGGAKNSTVIYVSEDVYPQLVERTDNGRNKEKEIVPAKLEAYKALTCSVSTPVTNPKRILVVDDVNTDFFANVVEVDDTKDGEPEAQRKKNYPIHMNASDGYGLISPSLSRDWTRCLGEEENGGGFCVRNSFCKGMLFVFDFHKFASEIANKNYIVTDVWNEEVDIRKVDVILTTSMLKLWKSYKNIKDYTDNCEKYGYSFSVTKIIPEVLENEANTNYQFLQSLELSDEDISDLVEPTVTEIKEVLGGDYRKSILFLNGFKMKEDEFQYNNNDITKALKVDKRVINDPFIRKHIHKMLMKRIREAKTGVLKVGGNFSVLSGDPFLLCSSIFKLKNQTGLLGSNEFYSNYWNERGVEKVACFRAPMTCHNNIKLLNLKNSDNMSYWYKHMKCVTILNGWDTTTHALNGADFDGDAVLTTDNKVLIKSIQGLDAIVCLQKSADAIIPTEEDLIRANKNSFGDEIGSVTNRITNMFEVRANYEKGSEEYEAIEYRIECGQNCQQNTIDKTKGIESKPMPKEWYDYNHVKPPMDKEKKYIAETNEQRKKREFNLAILANKKPYFFIYNDDPETKKAYLKYIKDCNDNCLQKFGLEISELKHGRTEGETNFLNSYYKKMPVSVSNSVMNRICRKIEDSFKDISENINDIEFDHTILITDMKYSKARYKEIEDLYKKHNLEMQQYSQKSSRTKEDKEDKKSNREDFVSRFKDEAEAIVSNSEELTNIIVEICYNESKRDKSKQFAWDICGEQMILNLLDKNNNKISYPVKDECGDFEMGGFRFKMLEEYVEVDR
ncbi:hypothetical protein [Paenibacillus donghaensis]|uniref:Uncharacterized protein n=1 Tax=Paenibacillus donghaensis TaxID=414771 RepID=A0A2Z2KFD5_9BACL|nr:hypothetical protein [Paenibacillus donghaensis]ASA21833.1 hypothetical protein B9T62_14245 [Paenibacillus donghaensis]